MSFWKSFTELDKKFSWSFIGVIIAILFGILGVYTTLIYEKKPSILFDITSEANVLEVREQLGNLSILFDGQNISEKELNLRILTLKIVNDGQLNILQNYFDQSEPWGFIIKDGSIIEVTTLESNSDYLQKKINPSITSSDSVIFDKVIFEHGNFITLKVLLLHPFEKQPTVNPMGKIAGLDKIKITKSYKEQSEKSIFYTIFHGHLIVQVVRLIAYPIATIFLIISIVFGIGFPVSSFFDKIKKKRRKSIVERYKNAYPANIDKAISIILDEFVSNGLSSIGYLSKILQNKSKLKSLLATPKKKRTRSAEIDLFTPEELRGPEMYIHGYSQTARLKKLVQELKECNVITENNSNIEIDQLFKEKLKEFVKHLKSIGYKE